MNFQWPRSFVVVTVDHSDNYSCLQSASGEGTKQVLSLFEGHSANRGMFYARGFISRSRETSEKSRRQPSTAKHKLLREFRATDVVYLGHSRY